MVDFTGVLVVVGFKVVDLGFLVVFVIEARVVDGFWILVTGLPVVGEMVVEVVGLVWMWM